MSTDPRSQDATWIEDPADYAGETNVAVPHVTFRPRRVAERAVAERWVEFFSSLQPIQRLVVTDSWVTQDQLRLIGRQTGLRELQIDGAKVTSLDPLAALRELEVLGIGRTRASQLDPLAGLPLRWLELSEMTTVEPESLRTLAELRTLRMSGGRGMDPTRWLDVEDLEWLRPLQHLEDLLLVGVRVRTRDLSPIAALPALTSLTLPLRRDYRTQVEALAARSEQFAAIAARYVEADRFLAHLGSAEHGGRRDA